MQNYNILIVEDTEFINNSVKKTLTRFDYHIEQAFTLEETVTKLSDKNFHLILLDLNLPDGSGLELVSNIKILSNAKIIILTGDTDLDQREFLFKEGILDYIVKDKYFNDAVSDINNTIKKLEENRHSTILVIDDSRFLQTHITNILKYRNYNVVSAFTSKDGLEKLEQHDISMIILDMELPDIHGLTLLRKIRKNKLFVNTPIMVLSSHHNAELVRDSFKAGAFDFIQKPFHIEELVLKVEISIDSNRKNRALLEQEEILSQYKEMYGSL